MTHTSNRSSLGVRWSRASAVAVAALVLASCLPACERTDPDQRALDAANIRLETLSVAGANPVYTVKRRQDAYREVIKSLEPITSGSDVSRAQAAMFLVARAKCGLGEIAAADASAQEREFLSQITVTRALLDQWMRQQSVAAALSTYDPSKDLADLDKQIAQRTAEAQRLQADKAAQERVVADIQARADKARGQARAQRDREAAIRKRTEGVSQTEREEIIKQAVEVSRAGDALDREASDLGADAAKESPRVEEIGNQVERLNRQVDSLKKAKTDIQARAETAHKQADQARQDAAAAGVSITKALEQLNKTREAASAPTDESVKEYGAAATSAKNGADATPSREAKTEGYTIVGSARQSLGDVLSGKARSLAIYVGTLDALAKAQPALPDSPKAAAALTAAGTSLETASKDAKAAYVEARSAYERAGGSGDVKSKLETLQKAIKDLEDARENPTAPKPAPAAAAVPEAKPADAGAAAAPAAVGLSPEEVKAVEAEVRAALKDAQQALVAGDIAKISEHIAYKSDGDKKAVEAILPVILSGKKLDDACKAKFGKNLAALIQETKVQSVKTNPMFLMFAPMVAKGVGVSSDPDAADKATIKAVSKTEAEALAPGETAPAKFVKDGAVWKLSLGDTGAGGAQMAGAMGPLVKAMGDTFGKVADNTTAGKYPAADDMLTDLSAMLMGAMGNMPGMPGAPGGPKPKPPGGG